MQIEKLFELFESAREFSMSYEKEKMPYLFRQVMIEEFLRKEEKEKMERK